MTKSEIIREISGSIDLSKEQIDAVLVKFMEEVKNANISGKSVFFRGFGTFGIRNRAAKKARNISKNESMDIPASCIPSFKPCKEYMKSVMDNVKPDVKSKSETGL